MPLAGIRYLELCNDQNQRVTAKSQYRDVKAYDIGGQYSSQTEGNIYPPSFLHPPPLLSNLLPLTVEQKL